MRLSIIALFFVLSAASCSRAQRVIQHKEARSGLIQLSESVQIPAEDAGYTLVLPESGEIKGMIVFFRSDRDTTMKIYESAGARQLAVMYATTGNWLEFLFTEESHQQLDRYIQQVVSRHDIPSDKLLFTGMSLQGTRALKMALYYAQGRSEQEIMPRAVAICDAPLDFVRFWKSCRRAVELDFQPAAAAEGAWVSAYLEKNLGGTPEEGLEAYIRYSPYCHLAQEGGSIAALEGKKLALRAYTEPDVQWWMETRRKDYYDMNAVDAAALINQLLIFGNEEAELILTRGKGVKEDSSRHPHSWSIVDEQELVDWFVDLIDD